MTEITNTLNAILAESLASGYLHTAEAELDKATSFLQSLHDDQIDVLSLVGLAAIDTRLCAIVNAAHDIEAIRVGMRDRCLEKLS